MPVRGGARARRPPVIYELSAGGTSHNIQYDWATTDRGGVSLYQDRAERERFTSLAHKIRILNLFGGPYLVPVVLIRAGFSFLSTQRQWEVSHRIDR